MSLTWFMTDAEYKKHREEKKRIWKRLDYLSGGLCPGEISCQFRTPTERAVWLRLSWFKRILSFDWAVPEPPDDIFHMVNR